jgi:hypothetical protein
MHILSLVTVKEQPLYQVVVLVELKISMSMKH